MNAPLQLFLGDLEAAAGSAAKAEDEFRHSISARIKALETERAFAFRRLNLMRAVMDVIVDAEDEANAVGRAAAALRGRLGWSTDSDARSEVVSHFAGVTKAIYRQHAPEQGDDESGEDVAGAILSPADALAAFETWYVATHPVPFWALFENVMPETPVVDF